MTDILCFANADVVASPTQASHWAALRIKVRSKLLRHKRLKPPAWRDGGHGGTGRAENTLGAKPATPISCHGGVARAAQRTPPVGDTKGGAGREKNDRDGS